MACAFYAFWPRGVRIGAGVFAESMAAAMVCSVILRVVGHAHEPKSGPRNTERHHRIPHGDEAGQSPLVSAIDGTRSTKHTQKGIAAHQEHQRLTAPCA